MTTSTNLPEVATIEFHGAQLITIKKDNIEFAAMRPVVEGIGMDWAKQSVKLNNDKGRFNCCLMSTVASDGKNREMLCMPISKLNGWLFSINPNKIPNLDVRK